MSSAEKPDIAERVPLAHHFDDIHQQHEAANLGMWVFLVTEILFFGGLFVAYIVYRSAYSEAFALASRHLDVTMGAINTTVLLTSSLTMALSVHAAQEGEKRATVLFLFITLLLGAAFLGIKSFEYYHKFEEHLIPGASFRFDAAYIRPAQIFFILYFVMTGVHAFHMVIGIGIIAVLIRRASRGHFTRSYSTPVEVSGLYWHFVDIVWIFLYPFLYLIDLS